MGLIKGEVKLEQYDVKWQADFLAEKAELEKIFGDVALEVEHIGSTSVRGLSAKPIIDIAVAVNALGEFAAVRPKFEELKQYSIKEDSTPGEILIRKHGENPDEVTHFIHVMEKEGPRYHDTILFRDTLRENTKLRIEYEELKQDLAKKYPHDRKSYTESKDYFIKSILREAKGKNAPRKKSDTFRAAGLFIGVVLADIIFLLVTVPTAINRLLEPGGFKFRATAMPETFVTNLVFIAPFALVPIIGSVLLMHSSIKNRVMWTFWVAIFIFLTTPVLCLLIWKNSESVV